MASVLVDPGKQEGRKCNGDLQERQTPIRLANVPMQNNPYVSSAATLGYTIGTTRNILDPSTHTDTLRKR